MFPSRLRLSIPSVAALLLGLFAVSQAAVTNPLMHGPLTAVRTDAKASYVYGCALVGDFCSIYNANTGTLVATVSGLAGAAGTMADTKGNWYVAESGANQVLEFPPAGTTPIKTLSDPVGTPLDVALSKTLVAASNYAGGSSEAGRGAR